MSKLFPGGKRKTLFRQNQIKRFYTMKKGFTFVEIMVVVAIMALLVGIAVPNLLHSRLSANEQNAISNIQTLSIAAQTYLSVGNTLPTTLAKLSSEKYIDTILGCSSMPCEKNGYQYSMGGTGTSDSFFLSAVPKTSNITGVRSFCVGSDSTVRVYSSRSTPSNQTACMAWTAL